MGIFGYLQIWIILSIFFGVIAGDYETWLISPSSTLWLSGSTPNVNYPNPVIFQLGVNDYGLFAFNVSMNYTCIQQMNLVLGLNALGNALSPSVSFRGLLTSYQFAMNTSLTWSGLPSAGLVMNSSFASGFSYNSQSSLVNFEGLPFNFTGGLVSHLTFGLLLYSNSSAPNKFYGSRTTLSVFGPTCGAINCSSLNDTLNGIFPPAPGDSWRMGSCPLGYNPATSGGPLCYCDVNGNWSCSIGCNLTFVGCPSMEVDGIGFGPTPSNAGPGWFPAIACPENQAGSASLFCLWNNTWDLSSLRNWCYLLPGFLPPPTITLLNNTTRMALVQWSLDQNPAGNLTFVFSTGIELLCDQNTKNCSGNWFVALQPTQTLNISVCLSTSSPAAICNYTVYRPLLQTGPSSIYCSIVVDYYMKSINVSISWMPMKQVSFYYVYFNNSWFYSNITNIIFTGISDYALINTNVSVCALDGSPYLCTNTTCDVVILEQPTSYGTSLPSPSSSSPSPSPNINPVPSSAQQNPQNYGISPAGEGVLVTFLILGVLGFVTAAGLFIYRRRKNGKSWCPLPSGRYTAGKPKEEEEERGSTKPPPANSRIMEEVPYLEMTMLNNTVNVNDNLHLPGHLLISDMDSEIRLENLLAKGGESMIYMCTLLNPGKLPNGLRLNDQGTVLKLYKADTVPVEDFESEVKILNACSDHSNVVRLIGYFSNRVTLVHGLVFPCYEMDLELLVHTKRYFTTAPMRIMWAAKQILSGMSFLHSLGVAHADLKPRNVLACWAERSSMLTSPVEFTLKIADFGTTYCPAPQCNRVNRSGNYTVPYASPERVLQSFVKNLESLQRADVYAFGVTLMEVAIGKKPFTGQHAQTITDVITALNFGSLPFLSSDITEFLREHPHREIITNFYTCCCKQNSWERPTFNALGTQLTSYLSVN